VWKEETFSQSMPKLYDLTSDRTGKQTRSEKQHKPIRQVNNEADEDSDDSLTSIDAVKQNGGKVRTTIKGTSTHR